MESGNNGDHGRGSLPAKNQEPLVSTIIPAFNAAESLQETLTSVTRQTYRNLDIIVVDDGSTDDTAEIARRHMRLDTRVRLLQKENGGVASARNAGIHASRGEYVAFIDADDLWHRTKIEKQVAVLRAASQNVALVYAPFRLIDEQGSVLGFQRRIGVEGWVLYRHFHANLVGNGSSILVRRTVLEELGGFDTTLRAAGAEGCEDLLLQLRIAARYQFREVPEYLVGYRRRRGSMSSDSEQMLRSGTLAVRMALEECGAIPNLSRDAILVRYEWYRLRRAAQRGQIGKSMHQFFVQFVQNPLLVLILLGDDLMVAVPRGVSRLMAALRHRLSVSYSDVSDRHFYTRDPVADIGSNRPMLMSLVFTRLARFDRAYRPKAALVSLRHSTIERSDFSI